MKVRAFIASVFACGALLVGASTAGAAPPQTQTVHEKGLVESFVDVVSCDGAAYSITTTSNLVFHETLFNDGRVHATFTQTGTFVATPLGTGPSFTGHFTVWGGFNQNSKTANGTFTFNLTGTGSDGSRISTHAVEHFNQRPNGSVQEFFKCH